MSLDLLAKIGSVTPPLYLLGGLAEDILLRGSITTGHEDVDILVAAEQIGQVAGQLAEIGLAWEPNEEQPGQPWVFGAATSLPVEVWPCVAIPEGYLVVVPGPEGKRFRFTLPVDTFRHQARDVNGLLLHTISPLALFRMRAASARTRRRKDDQIVMEQLKASYSLADVDVALEEL